MSTIYVDMDGVVADFDGYVKSTFGFENKPNVRFTQDEWEQIIAHNPRIYRTLSVLDNAEQIIQAVKDLASKHDYDIRFLTAVPKNNDLGWAFWDKIEWIQEHFPGIPVWFGPHSTDKQHHHQSGDILIDDRLQNIEEWRGVGGQAILHKGDADDTIEQLKSLM
jgi:5'-nucleotidase